jgi:hypothetical protein
VVAERQMLAAVGTLDVPQIGSVGARERDGLRGR